MASIIWQLQEWWCVIGLYKNVSGQKIAVYAWDTANDVPKTGDAANITAQISKDFGAAAATNDTNPTELDATDHPGIYVFDLTQAETNADAIVISPVSGTSDIVLEPVQVFTENRAMYGIKAVGTAQAADATSVTLAAAEAFANDTLIGNIISVYGSDQGYSQEKVILDSAGDVVTVSAFTVTPTGTITYVIYAAPAGEGVAQTGDAYAAVQALNDLSAAEVNAEVDTALADYDAPTKAELDAGLAGLNDLDAAGVRSAVGLASANLDDQLAAIDGYIDDEISLLDAALDSILALLDDARGEPGQGTPPVNPDAMTKLDYIYQWARNKRDNDGTENRYYADDGTTIAQKQTTAESGGTVTIGEMTTGA